MSSIEPDDSSSQIDGGKEVAGGFVIARRDGSVLFKPTKEVFDQMASLVKLFVIVPLLLAVFLRRDHDFFPRFAQRIKHAIIGIISFIGQDCFGLKRGQEYVRTVQITRLSGG